MMHQQKCDGQTSDISGTEREAWCQNVNQDDGVCRTFSSDVCISNDVKFCDISSCAMNKLNNADLSGTMHSDVLRSDYSVVSHVETITSTPQLYTMPPQILFNNNLLPRVIIYIGFYDVTNNADIWYSYIYMAALMVALEAPNSS